MRQHACWGIDWLASVSLLSPSSIIHHLKIAYCCAFESPEVLYFGRMLRCCTCGEIFWGYFVLLYNLIPLHLRGQCCSFYSFHMPSVWAISWDGSHLTDSSFEQVGASMPALEQTTDNEWLCRQMTHSLFFLFSRVPHMPASRWLMHHVTNEISNPAI